MEWDDVIYLVLLLTSLVLGHFIRQISSSETKKWISTIIGFGIVLIVSGKHTIHPIVCSLVNALIIAFGDKRNCHILSFSFTFAYLFFFRSVEFLGIPHPPGHTNLIQMMLTLKLINLAFEVHDTDHHERKEDKSGDRHEIDAAFVNPSFLDIFHFSFCYIGVLTGPFFRYRTYYDWLHSSFSSYAKCQEAAFHRLRLVGLFVVLYLVAIRIWPIEYTQTEEFYTERSVLYRIWYLNPSFFIFRMRIGIGLVLSECVCIMAGLGAYPTVTKPKPGAGPTHDHGLLKQISTQPERAKAEEYNFDTIYNIDSWGVEFEPSFRHGMKSWNICIQYWLAVNVYKRFPTKKFRTGVTFMVSAAWHGVYSGYYLCLCSAPLYLPVEDLWVRLYRKDATGLKQKIMDLVIWFFRMHAFAYMAMAFLLLRIDLTLHYWSSIYFIPHVFSVVMFGLGTAIASTRKKPAKPAKIAED